MEMKPRMAQKGTPQFKFPRFSRKNSLSMEEQAANTSPFFATDDAHVNSSMNSLVGAFQQKTHQLQETGIQLLKAREEIQNLQSQVSSFSSDNCRLRIVNDKLQVSHNKIEEEVSSLQLLVLKAQERSDDTKRVLQSVEEDCRAWIPRIKEMLNLNYETRLSQINKSWEDLYNSLKEELDDSRTSVQENYNKYQQAATERDHFNHQLEESKSQLEGLEKEIQNVSKERDQMKDGWNQLKLSFNRDLENRILKTIQDLESERILHQSTLRELQDTLDKKRTLEAELKQSSEQLQEVLEKTRGERNHQKLIHVEAEQLREHVSQLTTNISKLQSENATLSASLALSQNELSSFRDKYHQIAFNYEELKLTAADASKNKSVIEEKVLQLENRLKTTTEDLDKTNSVRAELSQALQTHKEKLENEERLRIQSQQLINELSTQLMNSNHDLEIKSKDVEALTVELTPYKEQLRQLEIQLEGRTLNLDSMKIELEKYQKTCSELETETTELKSQLMEKSIQLDYRGMRLAEMEMKLQGTTPVNGPESKVDHGDVNDLEKKLTRKSFELEVTQEQLKEVETNLSNAEKQVSALKAQVALLEQSLDLFQKKAQVQNDEKERIKKRGVPTELVTTVTTELAESSDFQDIESPAKKAVTFKDPSPGEMYELVLKVEAKANELERQRQQKSLPTKTVKNLLTNRTRSSSGSKKRGAAGSDFVEASPILRSSATRNYRRHRSSPVVQDDSSVLSGDNPPPKDQPESTVYANDCIDID